MKVVAAAPARANLIGNPSDQYGGNTLSCTVALHARVSIEAARGCTLVRGEDEVRIEEPGDLEPQGDLFDLPRAALRHLGIGRLDARIGLETEIPLQSGMAGSTAQLVAFLHALHAHQGRRVSRHGLAELARDVERRALGVWCGFVDHYMTVFGGLCFVDFRGKATECDGPAPLATVEPLADDVPVLPFVLAFTGVRHRSDSVHRPIRERWEAGEPEVVAAYERVAAIGQQGKRALLAADWPRLGALMNENHAIQRELGGSGPSNEALIDAALAAGAHGAKLAGAGDGGTIVVAWTRPDTRPLERALENAGASAFYRPAPVAGVGLLDDTGRKGTT